LAWGDWDLAKYLQRFNEPVLWKPTRYSESYRLTIDATIVFRQTTIRLDR